MDINHSKGEGADTLVASSMASHVRNQHDQCSRSFAGC